MALFGTKKEAKEPAGEEKVVKKEAPIVEQKLSAGRDLSSVLKKPRITEKAVRMTENNVYTFEVKSDATKHDIRDAVRTRFGVTPRKIRIVKQSPRSYFSRMRGRRMSERGLKKAYVYLNEGDRIDLV